MAIFVGPVPTGLGLHVRHKVRPIHKRVAIVQVVNINRKDRSLETPVLFVRQDMHLLRHQPVVRRVLDPHTKDKTVQQMLLVTRGPRVRLVSMDRHRRRR